MKFHKQGECGGDCSGCCNESRERACPFCERLQLWSPDLGEWFHNDNLNKHCDEERLAYCDSSKLHKELNS